MLGRPGVLPHLRSGPGRERTGHLLRVDARAMSPRMRSGKTLPLWRSPSGLPLLDGFKRMQQHQDVEEETVADRQQEETFRAEKSNH